MSDRVVKESGCNCRKRRKREASVEVANARLAICAGCVQFDQNCKLMPSKTLIDEVKKPVSPCPLGLHS